MVLMQAFHLVGLFVYAPPGACGELLRCRVGIGVLRNLYQTVATTLAFAFSHPPVYLWGWPSARGAAPHSLAAAWWSVEGWPACPSPCVGTEGRSRDMTPLSTGARVSGRRGGRRGCSRQSARSPRACSLHRSGLASQSPGPRQEAPRSWSPLLPSLPAPCGPHSEHLLHLELACLCEPQFHSCLSPLLSSGSGGEQRLRPLSFIMEPSSELGNSEGSSHLWTDDNNNRITRVTCRPPVTGVLSG